MKIRVYVVDVKMPRWLRRTLMFGGVPAVILGLCALVYAAAVNGQVDFADGDVLTAATLNGHLAALQNQIQAPPPKSVVMTTLTAADLADTTKFSATGLGIGAYLGWAICNGNNATTNLTGRFPRMITTGAGATGGSDAAHTHTMASHTHAPGTMYAAMSMNIHGAGLAFQAAIPPANPFTPNHLYTVTAENESYVTPNEGGVPVLGATAAPSTDATSATDGRPAYYELVPLCKI